MKDPAQAVEAVENWFKEQFPDSHVDSGEIFDREVVLFRASAKSDHYELEITKQAFEDRSTETILGDLDRCNVGDRLRQDPTLRLQYRRSGHVPHFETRHVTCDGRQYRVVRDCDHNVRIFDSSDQLLEGTPSGLRVMQNSVYRRSKEKWCREIRSHRGKNQYRK